MKINEEKIQYRIYDICERISVLSNRIEATINASEIAKLEKCKSKLLKEKRKLINKLYPPEQSNE